MKTIDYKARLNVNINAKSTLNVNFYELVRRTAFRYDTSILRAYWTLADIMCPEID